MVSLYLLAPIFSVLLAYFGDNYGRKGVLWWASLGMLCTTIAMAFVPSYAEIGIWSTILFVTLRILQGISLAGEPFSAALYLIESTPLQKAPFYISILACTESVGGLIALAIGNIINAYSLSWRWIFVGSALLFFVSRKLRKDLTETKEFRDAFKRRADLRDEVRTSDSKQLLNFYKGLPRAWSSIWASCLLNCIYPFAFVAAYIALPKMLQSNFGFSDGDILKNNIWICVVEACVRVGYGYLCVKCSNQPAHWLRAQMAALACVAISMPYLLTYHASSNMILFLQCALSSLAATSLMIPHVLKGFPVIGRFTLASFGFALNRVIIFFMMTYVFNWAERHFGLIGITGMILMGIACVFVGISICVRNERRGMLWI